MPMDLGFVTISLDWSQDGMPEGGGRHSLDKAWSCSLSTYCSQAERARALKGPTERMLQVWR